MDCDFCLTGKMGFVRNLTPAEIIGQVRVLAAAGDRHRQPFNIVLMGMGEPLHNYDHVMTSVRILADEHGFNCRPVGSRYRRLAWCPQCDRLATEPIMPNLAVSLHATTNPQRGSHRADQPEVSPRGLDRRMPRFPLKRRSRITFEYVLLDGVNDTPDDARRLVTLLADVKAKVNLLPLNAAAGDSIRATVRRARQSFRADPCGSWRQCIGAQEPRPRHPRRVRPIDRGGPEDGRRPTSRCAHDGVGDERAAMDYRIVHALLRRSQGSRKLAAAARCR